MRLAVDSARQPADDGEALGGQLEAEPMRHPAPDIAGRARADDSDARGVRQLRRAAHEEERRRVGDLAQIGRIVGVGPFHQARADARQFAKFFLERIEVAKLRDTARGVARNSCGCDLVGTAAGKFFQERRTSRSAACTFADQLRGRVSMRANKRPVTASRISRDKARGSPSTINSCSQRRRIATRSLARRILGAAA